MLQQVRRALKSVGQVLQQVRRVLQGGPARPSPDRAWASGLTASAVRRADFVITGAIAAGQHHTLVLKEDGTVWGFGLNANGQVGNGTTTDALGAVQVLTGAVAIAAGYQHSLAVKADGTVWSWGRNDTSQLGRTGTATAPAQMTGVTNAVAVAGGTSHSLVLKADGTVWAVGANASGQIGDGSTTARSTAVQVLGLTGVTAITAGAEMSAAIETDSAGAGCVFTWGRNHLGQLGEASLVNRVTPVQVPVGLGALGLAAGGDTMAVRRSDLSVVTFGSNAQGQLGIGTTTDSATPRVVAPVLGARHVAVGAQHVLAQDSRGRVFGWGSNGTTRLGAGDSLGAGITNATTPYTTLFTTVLALAAGLPSRVSRPKAWSPQAGHAAGRAPPLLRVLRERAAGLRQRVRALGREDGAVGVDGDAFTGRALVDAVFAFEGRHERGDAVFVERASYGDVDTPPSNRTRTTASTMRRCASRWRVPAVTCTRSR